MSLPQGLPEIIHQYQYNMKVFYKLLKFPSDVLQISTLIEDTIDYTLTTHIICVVDQTDFQFLNKNLILDFLISSSNLINIFTDFLHGQVIDNKRTRLILYCSINYLLTEIPNLFQSLTQSAPSQYGTERFSGTVFPL